VFQVNVLADMELWGIGIDIEGCLRARNILRDKLRSLEKKAFELAGMTFSLHNPADIANVLFGQLKLPIPENQSKGKLHPSTDKHCLDLLRYSEWLIAFPYIAFCFFIIKDNRLFELLSAVNYITKIFVVIISRARFSPCYCDSILVLTIHWNTTLSQE